MPLALGGLNGDADIATHANQGPTDGVPACAERGSQILNVCQLYEQGPVVLALFIDAGSCTAVLGEMQALSAEFPRVRFAAVAIKGERAQLRRLVRAHGLTLPVGLDSDGAVAAALQSVRPARRSTSPIPAASCRARRCWRTPRSPACGRG